MPKGKIYALLGRNGAGKTTTMKMLLNLVKPTSGFIKIFNDIHLEDASKAYSRIGALIETPGFYDNLTGRENLEIIARLRGLNSIESVDQALSVVNLDKNDKKIFEKLMKTLEKFLKYWYYINCLCLEPVLTRYVCGFSIIILSVTRKKFTDILTYCKNF